MSVPGARSDRISPRRGLDPKADLAWLAALLGLLVAIGLARPLLPIDETRYAAVAWEMWARGDFLVPHLNGVPYHHKPPLLFWLLHAGWAVFGVNDWWPRLISPLFAAGTLALTVLLARRLWPGLPDVARMAPFILLATPLFVYFSTALMFDAMLSFFVALGLFGMVLAWQSSRPASATVARPFRRQLLAPRATKWPPLGHGGGRGTPRPGAGIPGFALLALGLGGALYAKGPVALLHLLPAALFAPWWMREQAPRWSRWYGGVLLALLGGAALILAWAIPAGLSGGEDYRNAIFWGQTAGRMVDSFAHQAPWWFYLAWLPLMLAPWLLWPRWWGGMDRAMRAESGVRFALFGMLFCLVFFSFVSGKRAHYLLPEFTLFALFVARAAAGRGSGGRWTFAVPALTLFALGIGGIVGARLFGQRFGESTDASALVVGAVPALVCAAVLALLRPNVARLDVKRVATAATIAGCAALVAVLAALSERYDMSALGGRLAQFEAQGRAVAVEGHYHGQWTFAGRLTRRLVELSEPEIKAWLGADPNRRAVLVYRQPHEVDAGLTVLYSRPYRGAYAAVVAAPAQ